MAVRKTNALNSLLLSTSLITSMTGLVACGKFEVKSSGPARAQSNTTPAEKKETNPTSGSPQQPQQPQQPGTQGSARVNRTEQLENELKLCIDLSSKAVAERGADFLTKCGPWIEIGAVSTNAPAASNERPAGAAGDKPAVVANDVDAVKETIDKVEAVFRGKPEMKAKTDAAMRELLTKYHAVYGTLSMQRKAIVAARDLLLSDEKLSGPLAVFIQSALKHYMGQELPLLTNGELDSSLKPATLVTLLEHADYVPWELVVFSELSATLDQENSNEISSSLGYEFNVLNSVLVDQQSSAEDSDRAAENKPGKLSAGRTEFKKLRAQKRAALSNGSSPTYSLAELTQILEKTRDIEQYNNNLHDHGIKAAELLVWIALQPSQPEFQALSDKLVEEYQKQMGPKIKAAFDKLTPKWDDQISETARRTMSQSAHTLGQSDLDKVVTAIQTGLPSASTENAEKSGEEKKPDGSDKTAENGKSPLGSNASRSNTMCVDPTKTATPATLASTGAAVYDAFLKSNRNSGQRDFGVSATAVSKSAEFANVSITQLDAMCTYVANRLKGPAVSCTAELRAAVSSLKTSVSAIGLLLAAETEISSYVRSIARKSLTQPDAANLVTQVKSLGDLRIKYGAQSEAILIAKSKIEKAERELATKSQAIKDVQTKTLFESFAKDAISQAKAMHDQAELQINYRLRGVADKAAALETVLMCK